MTVPLSDPVPSQNEQDAVSSPLFDAPVSSSAVLSDDDVYRYRLRRKWAHGPGMLFVMLNPSTADATQDDPTIRRCIGFAKREGCGAVEVVNLFAYRATDPDDLMRCPVNVVGRDNYQHVKAACEQAAYIVVAWGAHPCATPLAQKILTPQARLSARCLGVTKSGAPRHPLYVRADQPLIPWPALTASSL